jgi:hypothetical protein
MGATFEGSMSCQFLSICRDGEHVRQVSPVVAVKINDRIMRSGSGNIVEVTEPDTGKKMPPLVGGKFTDRPVRIDGASDQHEITVTGYLHALAVIASTRNPPVKIIS